MLNPWLLAAAVFGFIGLMDETKGAPKKKTEVLPAPKKEKEKSSPATIVNVGTGVKSEEPKPKAKKKPSVKVPSEPSGDG